MPCMLAWSHDRANMSLQSNEIERLLELGECEFPSRVELEREEKACKGYTPCR